MKVQTYECEEVKTETPEMSAEAISLIDSLELAGQQKLIAVPVETGEKTRCPYRKMRADEKKVFELLCPQKHTAKEFSECPIPLRVLQVFAHAHSLGMFPLIQIWSAQGEIKDPVLVAYESDETWRSDNQPFILARWADELDEWPVLIKKALEKFKTKVAAALARIKVSVSKDEAAVDNLTIEDAIRLEEPYYSGY